MIIVSVLFLCAVQQASGVIYHLNETEYDGLPPLFHLDEFYPCLRSPGDLYCYVDAKLTANASSQLLHIIEEYSANNLTHYDHTFIHWGICVTKSCQQHINHTDLDVALEACLNSSLYQAYQLHARLVKDQVFCTKFGETVDIDTGDIVVAIVFATILTLNLLGSFYDFFCIPGKSVVGRFLLCFSVKRNWGRLTATAGEGVEPRLRRFKMFNGAKACTTFLIIMAHAPLTMLLASNNPHFTELTYHNIMYHLFYNGHLIVQSFLLISGCLVAFNLLLLEEKKPITWSTFLKAIMLRWMRLSPPYAAILSIIATWMRQFRTGPMWKSVVGVEIQDCRRYWYYHLLYLNDYIDHSQCMGHTWYLAVDMKLTILGLLIFCLAKSWRARKIAIGIVLAMGVATPAAHVFFQNLYPIAVLSPEIARHFFLEDPTFNKLYKRSHTNVICFAIGLASGMWMYKLIHAQFNVTRYKKYRFAYWATVPASMLLIMSGGITYIDGVEVPLVARMAYAPAIKVVYGLMFGFIVVPGTVFKLETVYRGILEWRGWAVFARVSYCAYLVHVSVIRYSTADHTTLLHSDFFQFILTYLGLLAMTFMLALPCWMLIEAPFNQLVKLCFYPPKEDTKLKIVVPVFVINSEDNETAQQLPAEQCL